MKIRKFTEKLQRIVDRLQPHEDPEVVVLTKDPGIPARSSTKVDGVDLGFDWEHGRINISTEIPVVFEPKHIRRRAKQRWEKERDGMVQQRAKFFQSIAAVGRVMADIRRANPSPEVVEKLDVIERVIRNLRS